MNKPLLDALENCLRSLENGESVDAVLSRYPRLALQLRPLLASAQAARELGGSPAPLSVTASNRTRVLSTASRLRKSSVPALLPMRLAWRTPLAVASVLAFLSLSGFWMVNASARALPGDILYPVKRTVENTQLQLAFDPTSQQQLKVEFDQQRVDEVEELMVSSRVEQVEFKGTVSAQTSQGWLISGIPVIVTSQTVVTGNIQVGIVVDVSGVTGADGKVQAGSISVVEGNDSEDKPDQTPAFNATSTEAPDNDEHMTATPDPTQDSGHMSTITPTIEHDPTTMPNPTGTPDPTEDSMPTPEATRSPY